VDDLSVPSPAETITGHWLGLVVPKRLARRAVTRTLLKRQMRAVMGCHAPTLPPGLWVLRLKAPFDRQQFISAASRPLQQTARSELLSLLQRAAAPRG
jgi:ribonuclease P protein component